MASSEVFKATSVKIKSFLPLQHSKMSSQSHKSILGQFLPEHKLTSLKAAHSTSTFSVLISRKSQGGMRTYRWAIQPQTVIKICFTFGHFLEIFHWSCMKDRLFCLLSLTIICTKLDFEQLFLSCLDWRLVTEVSQLNAWARAGEQIDFFVLLISCLAM